MTKTQMMHPGVALKLKRHELVREIRAQAGELAIREDGRDPLDRVQSMNQRDAAVLRFIERREAAHALDRAWVLRFSEDREAA